MSDTTRDRDARAAMREIIRAGAAVAHVTGDDGKKVIQWSIPAPDDVARDANAIADAMATERRKREAAEAPKPTPWPPARDPAADMARALEHLETAKNEEVEAARREGRDAGLRKAVDWLADNGYGGAGMALARYIANHLTADAPPGVT